MARSSRKRRRSRRAARRPSGAGAASAAPPPAEGPRRRAAQGEPPQALWGSFPLAEIVVFAALVFVVVGFVLGSERGAILIGVGLLTGSLAGLELALREHLAGYRSHTLVLSAAVGMLVLVPALLLAPAAIPTTAIIVAALAAGGLAAYGLTASFRRASGGLSFRIARPRR